MPLDATTTTTMPTAGCPAFEPSSLTAAALQRLHADYIRHGHHPSEAQWSAIGDLLSHLERAAEGTLDDATVYLSAIPAGCGKSTSLRAFAASLVSSPAHAKAGMLIAVNRLEEVTDMAEGLAGVRDSLCVICSDPRIVSLGAHTSADTAQVVVTTQAALRESLKHTDDFDSLARFHFRQRRRTIIAWDEALAMNRGVALDASAILDLHKALERQSPQALDALLRWRLDLKGHPEGLCSIPDFRALGVDFAQLEQEVDRDELVTHAKALSTLSGRQGFIVRDNRNESGTLITHVPELPVSILPTIVTDASGAEGVQHVLYRQMARDGRFRVVKLAEGPKTYANLAIRVVPKAASRSAYRDKTATTGRDLVEMTLRYIRSVAPAPVLVVGYKGWMNMKGVRERTIREALEARLTEAERHPDRFRYAHWGAHTASNKHESVRHVLLAGLNFLPKASAHAASGAALNKSLASAAATDHPTADQVEEMRRGMLRDASFQAILRGNARHSVGSDCGVMEAVVFQAPQTGLTGEEWMGMFPGAVVRTDQSLMPSRPLRGNLELLSETVQARLDAGDYEMTEASLYAAAGIDRSNFGKLKRRPEWTAWLSGAGLYPAKLAGGALGLRRARCLE